MIQALAHWLALNLECTIKEVIICTKDEFSNVKFKPTFKEVFTVEMNKTAYSEQLYEQYFDEGKPTSTDAKTRQTINPTGTAGGLSGSTGAGGRMNQT